VGYFHLVFTLPHLFNGLILAHKKIVLSLLFKAVSETLLEFGQRRLGGTVGITAVLHTWDQKLQDHFHLHCLVPAGALSLDHSRWIKARRNFLFPAFCSMSCPMASCASVISVFWLTEPRSMRSLNVASSWGLVLRCLKCPKDQPRTFCVSSPASIFPAAPLASLER
jgi:hypothetical protein